MAFFQCGATRLMVSRADAPEVDHPSSIVYFATGDIHASKQAMSDRGVRSARSRT